VSPNSFPYELPLQVEISSAQAKAFLEVIRSALIFRSSSDVANLYIHSTIGMPLLSRSMVHGAHSCEKRADITSLQVDSL